MKTIKLKDILSISGKGGLFRHIAQARNGIVVEALEGGKRHVAPASARVSSLEDIAIFTKGEEVPLSDVFMTIYEKNEGKPAISHKSPSDQLKSEFEEIVPEYDEERVYISDIKKVFHWYNQLQSHDLLEVIEKEEKKEGEEAGSVDGAKPDPEKEPSGEQEPEKGPSGEQEPEKGPSGEQEPEKEPSGEQEHEKGPSGEPEE